MGGIGLRLGLLRLVARRRWSALDMEGIVERFRTPEGIRDYMAVVFEYVRDRDLHGEEELWQPPRRTLELKQGDCEDFALFAWHLLRLHGREAHVFTAFTETTGHAVCAFEERGRYHTLCNEGLVRRGVRKRGGGSCPGDRVGRELAESIYPRTWVRCSFVRRLRPKRRPDGTVERLVPTYRWIHPGP